MKAIVHQYKKGVEGLEYKLSSETNPNAGEVKVKLKAAGLNHRDLFIINNRKEMDLPLVIGSDGAGIVTEIGEGVSADLLQTEVIINPSIGWDNIAEVPELPEVLGGPKDGTFAEYVIVPAENVVGKPSYLTWKESGVLSLSALTAYRALFTKGRLKRGEHVLIPGIGGGVATFAMLFAKAIGAKVSVTSRVENKRKFAEAYGADFSFNSSGNWEESLCERKVDLIIDSIGPATFLKYFDVLKPNGRIVNFGASSGDKIELPLRALFYNQIDIMGTSMGSSEEFNEMIKFIEKYKIKPIMDKVYSLEEAIQALRRMEQGEQFGNIALRME
ncbi:zinc-binding dehydrogenase [Bacillus cereus group sp. BfR-BA-00331]|uniref:zinc-binding dehydrogenase n=1 Tax=Bacillus cereus group TaxID=86661 RepID=UPI00077246CC|nr:MULTISPECIES: zinc-binding dehydrogenase [Bacillus cereus group]ONG64946.1 alcohol dehydrogenase [Bacillus cereus]MDA2192695.1 zinc-binding dehydrogenase [Bacillus cereus group sp. Bc238]MDA2198173.1 zinc-binding dehydrogenase [Bacillus cereus group sp. Bc237]MDA2755696.1 zinc-binding dehydrogenase [Bacillus cereus group sp. Bc007]MDA2761372.1 zinc-binding dehydrogenase [Bacillus cereus group sp. Bc008]